MQIEIILKNTKKLIALTSAKNKSKEQLVEEVWNAYKKNQNLSSEKEQELNQAVKEGTEEGFLRGLKRALKEQQAKEREQK